MIGTLQKRFVKTAMTAITVLLLVIALATGGLYTFRVYSNVKWMAEMLADNKGIPQPGEEGMAEPGEDEMAQPPEDGTAEGGGEYSAPPEGDSEGREDGRRRDGNYRRKGSVFSDRRMSADNALSYRFFLVQLSSDGQVEETDTSRIYSVSEEEAGTMAQEVAAKGRKSGITDRFFYYIKENSGGSEAVFIDVSSQTASIISLFVISVIIAVICWVLMFLFVSALSRRTIAPIADNMLRQRQFVTNAGHELKTPLAIILANTEALELFNGESKWTVNIKSQVERLNGLMQNLLTLSKMDEADVDLPMEMIDMADLIGESLAPFEEPARGKNIAVRCDVPHIKARGNRDSMAQLFGILFDNAVKYTPAGGSICITALKEGRHLVIEERNSIDPSQAAENPEQLFDRFYRRDKARTQKGGGYGIGLSAAKAIAGANRAEITARYEDEETIVFRVKMVI